MNDAGQPVVCEKYFTDIRFVLENLPSLLSCERSGHNDASDRIDHERFNCLVGRNDRVGNVRSVLGVDGKELVHLRDDDGGDGFGDEDMKMAFGGCLGLLRSATVDQEGKKNQKKEPD